MSSDSRSSVFSPPRFTLAQLLAATALVAAALALVRQASLGGVLAMLAGAAFAGSVAALASGRLRPAFLGGLVGATLACLPYGFAFWPPIVMLLGAAVGAIVGLNVDFFTPREEEPRRTSGPWRVGAVFASFVALTFCTMDYEEYFVSTCSHCRVYRTNRRWFGRTDHSFRETEITHWYRAHRGEHVCRWHGTDAAGIHSLVVGSVIRADGDRVARFRVADQLEFLQHAPPELLEKFFGFLESDPELGEADLAIDTAWRFLDERRRKTASP